MSADVRLSRQTLRQLATLPGVQAAALGVARDVADDVRGNAAEHVGTGRFLSSITSRSKLDGGARVASDDPAAPYIEHGTEDTPRYRDFGRAAANRP